MLHPDFAVSGENRFESNPNRYAQYLQTPEGRLRTELAFANLQDFLPAVPQNKSLRALDLGCGTGASSVPLARAGMDLTLFDSSPAILEVAQRATAEAGMSGKVTFKCGDVAQLGQIFQVRSFDIVLCHNLLEYLDDPAKLLGDIVRLMRDSSSIVSILVRSQAGEVLKAALHAGDIEAAESYLVAEWGQESLYGGKVRLFTPDALEAILKGASLRVIVRRGVRVIADYLPAQICRSAEYERIFVLERKLGSRPEFCGVARYMHFMARRDSDLR